MPKSSISPYVRFGNNPLTYIDPLGLDTVNTKNSRGGFSTWDVQKDGSAVGLGISGQSGDVVVKGKDLRQQKANREWRQAKFLFEQRTLNGQPTIQDGDNQKYQDLVNANLANFQSGARVEKNYRRASMEVAGLLVAPVVAYAAAESGAAYYLTPRLFSSFKAMNVAGGVADLTNQFLVQGKTLQQYNISSTLTSVILGGNSIVGSAFWASTGSLFDLSMENVNKGQYFNEQAGAAFTASFAGNLLGGITGKMTTMFAQYSLRTGYYSVTLARSLAVGLNTVFGIGINPIGNEIESNLSH